MVKLEGNEKINLKTKIIKSKYKAKENKNMIKIKSQIDENIKNKSFTLVDARSKNDFEGLEEPEPRPGKKWFY